MDILSKKMLEEEWDSVWTKKIEKIENSVQIAIKKNKIKEYLKENKEKYERKVAFCFVGVMLVSFLISGYIVNLFLPQNINFINDRLYSLGIVGCSFLGLILIAFAIIYIIYCFFDKKIVLGYKNFDGLLDSDFLVLTKCFESNYFIIDNKEIIEKCYEKLKLNKTTTRRILEKDNNMSIKKALKILNESSVSTCEKIFVLLVLNKINKTSEEKSFLLKGK